MRRRHTAILVCVIVLATSFGAAQDAVQASPEQPSITVNGEPLKTYEIYFAMQAIAHQMQQRKMQQLDQEQLARIGVQEAVNNRLLLEEAKKQGVELTAESVAQVLDKIVAQAGGREKIQEALTKAGVTMQQFEQSAKDSQTIQTFIETQIVPTVTVADHAVEEFYSNNPQYFAIPPQVRARHILIKVGDDATPEQKAAALERAKKARQRALDGEDFAALATELSEGPSASRGGDLGFFSDKQMVAPFSEAAFALAPGEISDVVETSFGYHVIKLEERREATTKTLDEARPRIKGFLEQQGIGEAIQALVTKLRSEAEVVGLPEETGRATPDEGTR